jgi:DNA-binding NarL/FixJ family response regulator
MSKPQIRVLCVDDHALMREGLALILGLQQDMVVVASAPNGAEAVALYRSHRPDVTLMDLHMPVMNGLEAIRTILSEDPTSRIVVLTMYEGDADVQRALKIGAASYVLKDSLSADLVRVVRAVHAGARPMLPNVEARLLEHANEAGLTEREVDILELVGKGMRNKEVAAVFGVSEETVHVHLRNIFTKLNVTDRTAAVRMALQRGFIHL